MGVGELDKHALQRQCIDGYPPAESALAHAKDGVVHGVAPDSVIWPSEHWTWPIRVLHTPGHTPGSICLIVAGTQEVSLGIGGKLPSFHSSYSGDGMGYAVLTGDTLFQGNVGRIQSAKNAEELFTSLQKIKELPSSTLVFPAHHYGYCTSTTIENESKETGQQFKYEPGGQGGHEY